MPFQSKKRNKEVINKLKRINPKLWRDLISEAEDRGLFEAKRIYSFIKGLEKFYDNDADKILRRTEIQSFNGSFKDVLKEYHTIPVASIDGSMVFGGIISTNYYVLLSSSIVLFPNYYSIAEPMVKVEPKIKFYPTKMDEDNVKKIALLDMMFEETRRVEESLNLLSRVSKKAIVILDGPIIDPPKGSRNDQRYINYVKKRVNAFRKHLERGNIVIGYVKRISGRMFVESFKSFLEKYRFPLGPNEIGSLYASNDFFFLNILFEKETLVINYSSISDFNNDYIVWTEPKEVPTNVNDYDLYRHEGLYVYYTYAKIGVNSYPRRKVARIEIAFNEDVQSRIYDVFENALKVIYLWTPIGLNNPLPVQIAHKSCTIRKTVAKVLIKDIMTRFIASKLPNIDERFKLHLLRGVY